MTQFRIFLESQIFRHPPLGTYLYNLVLVAIAFVYNRIKDYFRRFLRNVFYATDERMLISIPRIILFEPSSYRKRHIERYTLCVSEIRRTTQINPENRPRVRIYNRSILEVFTQNAEPQSIIAPVFRSRVFIMPRCIPKRLVIPKPHRRISPSLYFLDIRKQTVPIIGVRHTPAFGTNTSLEGERMTVKHIFNIQVP